MKTLETAKKYIEKGFAVIPLAPSGKNPILEKWTTLPFPQENDVIKWFSFSNNNIGIRCGEISNLIVVDVDLKNLIKEGNAQKWEEIEGLPTTYRVRTVNGGWQYYYKYNGHPSQKGLIVSDIKTISGKNPTIDIQSDGTQVVAPPSLVKQDPKVGEDIIEYQWDNKSLKLSEITEFPFDLFIPPPPAKVFTGAKDAVIETIKERLPIVEFAKSLGIELNKNNTRLCLWHEERHPSLGFSNRIKAFKCFSCEETGDIFTLYQKVKEVDFKTALEELKSFAGISSAFGNNPTYHEPGSEEKESTPYKTFIKKELGEVKWLAKPLISEGGITILSGAPGQYKTFIGLHMAVCLSKGNMKVFGNFETPEIGVPIMIIDEENNERRLQTRFRLLTDAEDLPIFLYVMENIKLTENKAKKLLNEMTKKGIKVVILDSLVRFFDFDENSSQEINKSYDILKIFTKNGISVILTHHHRKQGPFKIKTSDISAISEQIRGSTDILAMCDIHLAVMPIEKSEIAIIQSKQRDAEIVPPFKIEILEDENGFLTFGYGGRFDEDENKKNKAKDVIFNIISESGKITREDLENKLSGIVGRTYLMLGLRELIEEGKIDKKTKKELGIECDPSERKKKVFFPIPDVKNL